MDDDLFFFWYTEEFHDEKAKIIFDKSNVVQYKEINQKEFDEEIQRRLVPYQKEFKDIQSVTGIKGVSAASVIAEIGVDMSRFPDEAHISSWAGVCPGNNESAGKKKSGKTRRGNNYLKATLTESAWAAARTKETAFSAMYRNIAGRRGTKRALVAVGHQILIEVYRVLKTG